MLYVIIYLVLISLISFFVVGNDKSRAKHRKKRVPEGAIYFCALIGGSVAVYIAMHVFHHKTKKTLFSVGIPLLMVFQAIFVCAVFLS